MPPKRKRPAVVYIIEDDEEDLPNQVHSIDDEEELDVLRGNDQPAPKRSRKGKGKAKADDQGNPLPEPEKRGAVFKKKCPKTTLERMQRCMEQRFFMIDREREGNELLETFKVLGSTGNVYTIAICTHPSCDCPDGSKGNCCKHIIFCFLKVLGLPATSNLWYQKRLLSTEVSDIFLNAKPVPQNVVNMRLTHSYNKAKNGEELGDDDVVPEGPNGKQRLPEEGDTCPICYEDLPAGQAKGLVFCSEGCGGGLHAECFRQWASASKPVTCVYCRAKWPVEINYGSAAATTSEGYTNLAGTMGLSGIRDTSSYYQGPQRGVSWKQSRSNWINRYGSFSNGYGHSYGHEEYY